MIDAHYITKTFLRLRTVSDISFGPFRGVIRWNRKLTLMRERVSLQYFSTFYTIAHSLGFLFVRKLIRLNNC